MQLYYWKTRHGNFGDDLNEWFWQYFAPELFANDDGVIFFGVGSILTQSAPRGGRRVVFGSGAGYSTIPPDFGHESWAYYAVRGPLTARLLELPSETAVSDPAILLALIPELQSESRSGTVFVPHWETAADKRWQRAARLAEVEFVDPRGDARAVIRRIAGAKLVLAESMHAAIAADAFRVPWIPIICGHENLFKWSDWTLSLGMTYSPLRLGPLKPASAAPEIVGAARDHGQDADRLVEATLAALMECKAVPLMPNRPAPGIDERLKTDVSEYLDDAAADQLQRAKAHPPQLSDHGRLQQAQDELLARLRRLQSDHRKGAIAGFSPFAGAIREFRPAPTP